MKWVELQWVEFMGGFSFNSGWQISPGGVWLTDEWAEL